MGGLLDIKNIGVKRHVFTINNDDENRVILSGTGRNTTFHVAHTQEDFTVEVLAERVVNENVLTIPENTSDPIQIYTNYSV